MKRFAVFKWSILEFTAMGLAFLCAKKLWDINECGLIAYFTSELRGKCLPQRVEQNTNTNTPVMRPEDPRKNRLHYFQRFLTELKGTTFYFFKYITCHLAVIGVIVGELYYLHWLMKIGTIFMVIAPKS